MGNFSVIIPTRDRPQFLQAAVDSVLQQNWPDLEIIVVNDGATAPNLRHDGALRVIDNGQRGPVVARNTGIAAARGSHIAFLDDDDQWVDVDHLGQAMQALRGAADFHFADGQMCFETGQEARAFARDASLQSLEIDNTILISTVCYPKSLHDQLGGFDVALPYYWDWDWYLRVARAGLRMVRRRQIAVNVRVHADNMSGEHARAARQENLDALASKHGLKGLNLKNHLDFL